MYIYRCYVMQKKESDSEYDCNFEIETKLNNDHLIVRDNIDISSNK